MDRTHVSIKKVAKGLLFPVPSHLRSNFRSMGPLEREQVRRALRQHFLTGSRAANGDRDLATDLHEHVLGRLEQARTRCIPWLASVRDLVGLRVLEVGAGTGSSTLALVEQGARVTAIDVDAPSLEVARSRLRTVGLHADFHLLPAETIGERFAPHAFDLILYYASLEHMLVRERLQTLEAAWRLLPPGGTLAVFDTPNRLWFFDSHTSWLPFFQWLPEELALLYASHSPRPAFRTSFSGGTASGDLLSRLGRGVSFHDFELALGNLGEIRVISSLSAYEGLRHVDSRSPKRRLFKAMLHSYAPTLHEGFFGASLDLMLEK